MRNLFPQFLILGFFFLHCLTSSLNYKSTLCYGWRACAIIAFQMLHVQRGVAFYQHWPRRLMMPKDTCDSSSKRGRLKCGWMDHGDRAAFAHAPCQVEKIFCCMQISFPPRGDQNMDPWLLFFVCTHLAPVCKDKSSQKSSGFDQTLF